MSHFKLTTAQQRMLEEVNRAGVLHINDCLSRRSLLALHLIEAFESVTNSYKLTTDGYRHLVNYAPPKAAEPAMVYQFTVYKNSEGVLFFEHEFSGNQVPQGVAPKVYKPACSTRPVQVRVQLIDGDLCVSDVTHPIKVGA